MKCYKHPNVDAIATCVTCGKPICDECAVEVGDKVMCRDCVAERGISRNGEYDPSTAFLIELVGGFFGFLGIGHMYVGRTEDGVLRLVLWLLYNIIAWVVISALLAIIVGFVCIPVQLAIQVGVPIWSATGLRDELRSEM